MLRRLITAALIAAGVLIPLAYADTLTTNLLLNKQTVGGNLNTWGTNLNTNFQTIDDKLGTTTTVNTTGGTTVLTSTQELAQIVKVTGALVSNATLQFSGRGGTWVISNETSGAFTLTAKLSGQTGVGVTQGTKQIVYSDAVDIKVADTPVNNSESFAESTVASAATANVLGASTSVVAVSGTTTITSLGTGANTRKWVRFAGALTLTHNATSLILPTGANITTAAGDTMIVVSDASSNARVLAYQRTSGAPLALATDSVGAAQIATDAVGAAEIATDAVGAAEIATDAVGAAEIAAGAVGTSEIADASVAFGDIATAAVATQAEAEAGTSSTTLLTPQRGTQLVSKHQASAKAWAYVTNNGTAALVDGFNVSGVVRDATGRVTVSFSTAMANANYAAIATGEDSANTRLARIRSKATGSVQVQIVNASGTDVDSDFNVIVFGD